MTNEWQTQQLPDGRVVECMDVRLTGNYHPDGLELDVTVAIDGAEIGVVRVVVPDEVRAGDGRG